MSIYKCRSINFYLIFLSWKVDYECNHIDKIIIVNNYLNGNKGVKEGLLGFKVGEIIYIINKILRNETLNIYKHTTIIWGLWKEKLLIRSNQLIRCSEFKLIIYTLVKISDIIFLIRKR